MSDSTTVTDAARAVARSPIAKVVGFLICVELASGVLQGYYTPIFTDIARHLSIKDADVNWFEAAQLIVSALVVPLLARLGDLVGHRRVLLLSTVVTALASWGVAFAPSFGLFLVAWAVQGFYVVWLPMEVAIIHRRTGGAERRVRGAAGLLVAGLELGVIAGALTSGALAESLGMTALLALPAVVVTLALVAIWFGVEESPVLAHGSVDWRGFWLVTVALALVMGGLVMLRVLGPGSAWPWVLVVTGGAAFVPFARVELAHPEPLVDLRVLARARTVARAGDGLPLRGLGPGRADPALDLRPHRPGRHRLRPRRLGGQGLDHHRRLRAVARGGRAPAPPPRAPHRHAGGDGRGSRARRAWATCSSCRSTTRSPRP